MEDPPYRIEEDVDVYGRSHFRIVADDGVSTGKYAYSLEKAKRILERLSRRAALDKKERGVVSCVNCDRGDKFNHYHVYVIELNKNILTEKKRIVRNKNPRLARNRDYDCFYVGSTRHRCECRFTQHIQYARGREGYLCMGCYDGERKIRYLRKEGVKGTKGSKIAGRYGIRLRPDLYSNLNPINDKKTALEVERELAQFLRKKGAMVIQS